MMTKMTFRLAAIPAFLAVMGVANAASLKSDVVVTGPVVTLGDVLTDAGAAANVQVAPAPAPGTRMLLSSGAIARTATDNGIEWENPYRLDGVSVTRAGKAISSETITKTIGEAIREHGDNGEKSIQLSGMQGTLYVPVNADETVSVRDMDYNAVTGKFSATLTVPGENGRSAAATVTGRATEVIKIPVLNRAVARGDIISKNDIYWIQVSPSQVQSTIVSEASDLIGKAARRPLRPSLPLRDGDVQEPILVGKNTLVTLVAAGPNLVLSTIGRSLDDGSKGDVIRVMNNQSHKLVQGTVISANEVRVEISEPVRRAVELTPNGTPQNRS